MKEIPRLTSHILTIKEYLVHAVADGTIHKLTDGRPQNNGDAQDVVFASIDEYGGNYVIQDIGNGLYAFYAHCAPNEFFVAQGDFVKEGDPIGLFGQLGKLHRSSLAFSNYQRTQFVFQSGQPFVIKKLQRSGTLKPANLLRRPTQML